MSRDHSKLNLGRNKRNTSKPSQYIIYVEGRNTEDTYIKLLKKSCCKVVPIVKKGDGIGSCVKFVNDSEKAFTCLSSEKRRSYKEKWLMFDYDGHEDFSEAIKLARTKGFKVAFSSMCIEYWFLLHFEEHDGGPIPLAGDSHSKAQINRINWYINNINKHLKIKVSKYDDSKCVKEDFFDLMLAINSNTGNRRIIDACNRAVAIHNKKLKDGIELQESVTTIYQLLISLGVITINSENKFELNVK